MRVWETPEPEPWRETWGRGVAMGRYVDQAFG